MRKWTTFFSRYAGTRSISDFALIKLCLFSFGLFFGTMLGDSHKKPLRAASLIVFLSTYIPLLAGFLKSASEADEAQARILPTEGSDGR